MKVTLQPDATPKGIAADILFSLGDPAWSSGTVQTLTNRAVGLLEHCGVELIILDEFNHLFDSDRSRVMTKAAQWLKVLIVNTRISVVVSGMPEATYVLDAEHTERRFKERLTLRRGENTLFSTADPSRLLSHNSANGNHFKMQNDQKIQWKRRKLLGS